jgi:hypothetical protein
MVSDAAWWSPLGRAPAYGRCPLACGPTIGALLVPEYNWTTRPRQGSLAAFSFPGEPLGHAGAADCGTAAPCYPTAAVPVLAGLRDRQ